MSEVTLTARPRLGPHARLQWDPAREKQVLLAPEKVLVLNETAAAILAFCDGQHTVAAIAATLAARYDRAVDQDVLTLLRRLLDRRLIEVDDDE
jgi:pyrroloquinoline quinone biosynthesis protein D